MFCRARALTITCCTCPGNTTKYLTSASGLAVDAPTLAFSRARDGANENLSQFLRDDPTC